MAYYAGIDGGQSGTTAAIADESGRILARGQAGPADEVGQTRESTRLRDALAGALGDALRRAQLPADTRFAHVVAGVSGYEGRVYGAAPDLPADGFTLLHDTAIAHAGALGGEPGIVVIAGTGSVAYAVAEDGASALVGGWGYLFGDEGSAFRLARDVITEAMRDADAGAENDFTAPILRYFDVPSLRKLSRAFYAGAVSRSQVAAFATEVLERAAAGNARATAHVRAAASSLAALAIAAAERTGMAEPAVAFAGGMLKSAELRERLARELQQRFPRAHQVVPKHDAAVGALLLAYKAAGHAAPTIRA